MRAVYSTRFPPVQRPRTISGTGLPHAVPTRPILSLAGATSFSRPARA
jgi:hypothetical protein